MGENFLLPFSWTVFISTVLEIPARLYLVVSSQTTDRVGGGGGGGGRVCVVKTFSTDACSSQPLGRGNLGDLILFRLAIFFFIFPFVCPAGREMRE